MREILFRGKRLDNGKQIEGYLVKNKFGPCDGYSYMLNDILGPYRV